MSSLVAGLVAILTLLLLGRATRVARHPARTVQAVESAAPDAQLTRRTISIAAWSRRARMRRAGMTPGAVAEWCDAIARRVRSGETLREAVRLAAPSDHLLAEATAAARVGIERGHSLTVAITACAATSENVGVRGRRHLELACAAIAAAAELGGSAATALDRVGVTLRLRAGDEQERAAHSAQARLSAHVLTLVPVGIIVVLAATDPAVRTTISTPLGVSTIVLGAALNVAGWWWMRYIIGAAR